MDKVAHIKKGMIILLYLFLTALPCYGGETVSVSIELDRSEAFVSDSIRMKVKVSGARKLKSEPVLKGLESFEVRKGGSSSRVQIINGRVESGVDYNYEIYPSKTGDFRIGPAEVMIGNRLVKSNQEALTVRTPSETSGINRGAVFLSATLSSTDVYVEEQALYTLRLYRQVRVRNISLELPKSDHLQFTQLGEPVEYRGLYNQKPYQILEVRYALTASEEGTYGIRPARMSMLVMRQGGGFSRNPFDDDFFALSSGRPQTVASEPLELVAKPLPTEGRPLDFSGLVGDFRIEARIRPEEIKVGESATLMVLIRGRGNVKLMPDLKIPPLEDTKVYPDQPVLEEEKDSRGLVGAKTMKWALVPEKEGEYELAPLTVSFFDAQNHRYRIIRSSSLKLNVLPGEEKRPLVVAGRQQGREPEPVKKEIEELGRDILPVHTSFESLRSSSQGPAEGLFFWLLLMGPLLLYGGGFCLLKLNRKSASSKEAQKSKKSAGAFYRKCRVNELTSDEMMSSVRQYLNTRFGLFLGSLTAKEAGEILRKRGVSRATAGEFEDLVRGLEDAIYTGEGSRVCHGQEALVDIIKRLEKEAR
ncbi:MAG: BatD family protein [Thermodesulfobacteriota bacterium]|nr:BatD family protein [Thermodesulfobacteriota bacterium]